MFKEKVLSFMQAHPKASNAIIGTAVSVGGSAALLAPAAGGLVASADEVEQASLVSTAAGEVLVTSASQAFSTAVSSVVPLIASVIGFNVNIHPVFTLFF